jgi:hypothetical protein
MSFRVHFMPVDTPRREFITCGCQSERLLATGLSNGEIHRRVKNVYDKHRNLRQFTDGSPPFTSDHERLTNPLRGKTPSFSGNPNRTSPNGPGHHPNVSDGCRTSPDIICKNTETTDKYRKMSDMHRTSPDIRRTLAGHSSDINGDP